MFKMNKIRCPLCCGKTFHTKKALIQHLAECGEKFNCPICQSTYSTISALLNHLNLTTCKPIGTLNTFTSADKSLNEMAQTDTSKSSVNELLPKLEPSHGKGSTTDNEDFEYKEDQDFTELHDGTLEDGDIYEELLEKDNLHESELNLLEENGHNRYTIVTHDDDLPAIMHNGSVITKQNSDGTISITSPRGDEEGINMHLEVDPVITVADKGLVSSEQDVYSCNSCGVSFTSVLEHVQNYHKDQDVVVEVNEQSQSGDGEESQEERDQPTDAEDQPGTSDTQSVRRVITDTGAIIDANTVNMEDGAKSIPLSLMEEEVLDKKGRVFTRRYVQIGNANQEESSRPQAEAKAPRPAYHQVVMKDIVTMDGGAKVKVYHCVACHIYVTDIDEFKSHPCRAQKYTCQHCSVCYDNAKSLSAHMKVHKVTKQPFSSKGAVPPEETIETVRPSGANKVPYKCDICGTIFPSNKSLKLHRRMHDPIKSRPIDPPVEENSEPTEDGDAKYFCLQCGKWIPVGYRAVHNDFHKSTENYNCDICNKKFSSSSYLVMHMAVHNTGKIKVKKLDKKLPYNCVYCSRQFARPHEKVKHERIHTGEKPHCCEICGKSFRVSYCLTLHMRTHTGARPYACQHCGKRFKAHSVYNHHLLTHSDVRAYQCPFCPKAFKTSVQLAGHKNSHTKPFSCTHCNRPFASLYAVRVHTETHRRQNNLKFVCKSCGASYARSFALKDHMKQVHQLDLDPMEVFEHGPIPPIPEDTPVVKLTGDKGWVLERSEDAATTQKTELRVINDLAMSTNESETVIV